MDSRICRHCGKVYKSTGALNRHISSAHSTNVYRCKYCPTVYKRTDNLNRHLAEKHGEGMGYSSNDWNSFPNHKECSTEELFHLNHTERATSPINSTEGMKTLTGKVREINPADFPKKTSGKVLTGKVIKSWRKERKWLQECKGQLTKPTPNIDHDKIKTILAQPKKPVKFAEAQCSSSTDPLMLQRLPTKPAVYNPVAKPVKISVPNPKKAEASYAGKVTLPNGERIDQPTQWGTHTEPAPVPGCSTQSNQWGTQNQSTPVPKCSGYKTSNSSAKIVNTNTLDRFLVKMRPGNIFRPALQAVQKEIHQVDTLFSKFGTVEEDLNLSESSSDSDSDLEEASLLEKAVLKMD